MDNLPEKKVQESPLLAAALNPELDAEKVKALYELHEKMMDREAKIEFNKAMSSVQAEIKPIIKDAVNKQTSSKYARLESVNKIVVPAYTAHGFALSFNTGKSELENHILIECEVSHSAGYSKKYQYDSPLDDKGIKGTVNKTDTHARGSSTAYGRRYLTAMIFNLAIADDDKDGNQAVQFIGEDEQIVIHDLIKEKGADEKGFLKFIGCPSVEAIPKSLYSKAVSALRAKK